MFLQEAGACGIVNGGKAVEGYTGGTARLKQRLARVRKAVARFAVRYGTIGVSLLVAALAVGIAGLTLTVAPENVKETWTQRLAIVIGGWSVAGGGIWLADYLWHKIKGVHQVLSRKEREGAGAEPARRAGARAARGAAGRPARGADGVAGLVQSDAAGGAVGPAV